MITPPSRYSMPAEWQPHERTFLAWPIRSSMVEPDNYEAVCHGYAQLVRAIADFEPVTLLIDESDKARLATLFADSDVTLLVLPHNDSWLRDNGPTFLVDDQGNRAGINWKFNAWGEKYHPWDLDDRVAPELLAHLGLPCYDAPLVMEGGSFHVDGAGTLLTTEECLLHPKRNPTWTKEQIETALQQYLGVRKVVWLRRGLDGDETDGHVDNIACFSAPGTVLMQICDDPDDDNDRRTQENRTVLKETSDALDHPFTVIDIPQPPAMWHKGRRLTLSYLNFYLVNGGLILPVFGGAAEKTDRQAADILQHVFPDRSIRAIDGMAIVREGGNVHCATQQMPAGNREG